MYAPLHGARGLAVLVQLLPLPVSTRAGSRNRRRGGPDVTYEIRSATYLNGFVGTGEVAVDRYCPDPLHTELRVRASDVLLSLVTLLIYTPHTLYVTCPRDAAVTEGREEPAARRTGA